MLLSKGQKMPRNCKFQEFAVSWHLVWTHLRGEDRAEGSGGFPAAADRDEPRMALTPEQCQVDHPIPRAARQIPVWSPGRQTGVAAHGVFARNAILQRWLIPLPPISQRESCPARRALTLLIPRGGSDPPQPPAANTCWSPPNPELVSATTSPHPVWLRVPIAHTYGGMTRQCQLGHYIYNPTRRKPTPK